MPFVPAAFTARLTPVFSLPNEQTAVNTLHVRNFDGWIPTNMQVLINEYLDWFVEIADTLTSNQVSIARVDCQDLSVPDSWQVSYTPPTPVVGANTSNVLPSNVSICTAFKSGYAGRSKNGRAYWVGTTETMVSGDYPTTAAADAVRDSWAEFSARMVALEWSHVIASYWSNGILRDNALITNINQYVVRTERVASQRRRLPGVGS